MLFVFVYSLSLCLNVKHGLMLVGAMTRNIMFKCIRVR